MKRFGLWGGVVLALVLIVGGAVWLSRSLGNSTEGDLKNPVTSDDHMKGSADAAVTLVEYSDFQCPACAAFAPVVKQLAEEYGDKIRIVYRHFPLPQHGNAKPAAYAAEAAGLQGKFWEMHDLIFERQGEWSAASDPMPLFLSYASALGLDEQKFSSDMNSADTKQRVERDFFGGVESRIAATPTFFLNGKKMTNPRSYDEFKQQIESAARANPR